jgi:hypothetical protein
MLRVVLAEKDPLHLDCKYLSGCLPSLCCEGCWSSSGLQCQDTPVVTGALGLSPRVP